MQRRRIYTLSFPLLCSTEARIFRLHLSFVALAFMMISQAEFFGYRPYREKTASGMQLRANETTDFFEEYENQGKREGFKSFRILIHDKSFGIF
jgi:hypothetical protein